MKEVTSVLWACTTCKRIFTGTLPDKQGSLPCGHTFDIASAPQEIVRSMEISSAVQEYVFAEDVDHHEMMDALEALIND